MKERVCLSAFINRSECAFCVVVKKSTQAFCKQAGSHHHHYGEFNASLASHRRGNQKQRHELPRRALIKISLFTRDRFRPNAKYHKSRCLRRA